MWQFRELVLKEDSGIFRRLKGGETDSRGLTSKGSCVLLKLQSWQNQYDAIPDTDNTQANIYLLILYNAVLQLFHSALTGID